MFPLWATAAVNHLAFKPRLMIAGSASEGDAERAHHGMMVLHKPVQLADLRRTVEQTL